MSDNRTDSEFRGPGAWIAGLILIAVGAAFFLENFGLVLPGHWWAVFILIPAVAALGSAWKAYADGGGMNGQVVGSLITAVVLFALTAMFLFDIDVNWNMIWPVILVVVGLSILARNAWRN